MSVRPDRRRPTMRDVAASLGISVNTVSRALADKDAVHKDTRQAVQAEAERLGYVPNHAARTLVMRNAMTLGLVITNPSNPFYAKLISAIEERGRVHGYSLALMVSEDNVATEQRATEQLLKWGVDGVLAVPVQHGDEHWRRLHDAGIPLVLVNRHLPGLETELVGVDYESSAAETTRLLLGSEPDQVLLIEEDLGISPVDDRIRGFTSALTEHGRPLDKGSLLRVPSRRRDSSTRPWDPIDAYQLGQHLAERLRPGAAILCGNDYFALGLYRAFGEAGLRIGEDVAIAGFGDHPFAAYLDPPLASVALPAEQLGHTAAEWLLRRLAVEAERTSEHTLLPARPVPRASLGRSFDHQNAHVAGSARRDDGSRG